MMSEAAIAGLPSYKENSPFPRGCTNILIPKPTFTFFHQPEQKAKKKRRNISGDCRRPVPPLF